VSPRTGLGAVEKRKTSSFLLNLSVRLSVDQFGDKTAVFICAVDGQPCDVFAAESIDRASLLCVFVFLVRATNPFTEKRWISIEYRKCVKVAECLVSHWNGVISCRGSSYFVIRLLSVSPEVAPQDIGKSSYMSAAFMYV
jgi:hypothetical protein